MHTERKVIPIAEARARRLDAPPPPRWKIVGGELVMIAEPTSERELELLRRLYENEPMDAELAARWALYDSANEVLGLPEPAA